MPAVQVTVGITAALAAAAARRTWSRSRPASSPLRPAGRRPVAGQAGAAREQLTDTAADAAIDQACRILRLPTVRARHAEIAAAASRGAGRLQGVPGRAAVGRVRRPGGRRKARLVRDAGFPRPKRLTLSGVDLEVIAVSAGSDVADMSAACR
jgi:hypothetical protein